MPTICADIVFRHGRAYLPTPGLIAGGPIVLIAPVLVTDIDADAIVAALERLAAGGHPAVSPRTREEWKTIKDPLLTAMGVSSWPKLARLRDSAAYAVYFGGDGATTATPHLHDLDAKGRWTASPGRTMELPGRRGSPRSCG